MPGVGPAPGGAAAAKDIRNLKRGTRHNPRRSSLGLVLLLLDQAKPVERAHHLADRACGHARIKRRCVELGMSQRPRVIMLTFYVIGIEGSVEPGQLLADAAGDFARDRQ